MDYKDLSVAVIGCGSIGKRHLRILNDLGLKEISAFDLDENTLVDLKALYPRLTLFKDYDACLQAKPDAVFILTPTGLHVEMAKQAVLAGCHVFIEKPLSTSLDGVQELEELARRNGKKVMVGFCFRYHAGLIKAKDALESGRIGRLINIRALMGEHFPTVRPDYMDTYYVHYSGALELVHDLDLAIWFAGQNVKKSYGVLGAFSDLGFKAPDNVDILLEFEDKISATVHLDFYQQPRRRVMELIGTAGVITIDFASWDEYTLCVYDASSGQWERFTEQTQRDDMFRDEDLDFLRSIAEDRPMRCDIAQGCKSLEVVLNIQK